MKTIFILLGVLIIAGGGATYYTKYLSADPPVNFRTVPVERGDLVAKVGPQVAFKAPGGKVDHNAPTAESLRKMHAVYFKTIDDHVAELNKKYQTKAVRVAPVGQAILKLREKIIAGEAPGLKQQNDLFSDPIGHAKAPLQALVAYCYLALIYEHNPVGLPAPAVLGKADAKLNRMLQEIAWEAVTSHPLSGVTADKR